MSTLRIPLHSRKYPGLFALIDEEDFDLVKPYRWNPNSPRRNTGSFYARCSAVVPTIAMQRLIMNPQPGQLVDHINRDTLDNRRCNLRLTDTYGNRANCGLMGNQTGLKGVEAKWQRWNARIQTGGKVFWLGTFDTAIEAALAYDEAALRLFGEFAATNASLGLIDAYPEKTER